MYVRNVHKKSTYLKWTHGLFGKGYRVASLSKLYFTVPEYILPGLKSMIV